MPDDIWTHVFIRRARHSLLRLVSLDLRGSRHYLQLLDTFYFHSLLRRRLLDARRRVAPMPWLDNRCVRVVRSRRSGRAGNNQFVRLRLLWCCVIVFVTGGPKVVIMREKASLRRSLVRLCDWLITPNVETFTTRFGRCRSLVPRLCSVWEVLGAPPPTPHQRFFHIRSLFWSASA